MLYHTTVDMPASRFQSSTILRHAIHTALGHIQKADMTKRTPAQASGRQTPPCVLSMLLSTACARGPLPPVLRECCGTAPGPSAHTPHGWRNPCAAGQAPSGACTDQSRTKQQSDSTAQRKQQQTCSRYPEGCLVAGDATEYKAVRLAQSPPAAWCMPASVPASPVGYLPALPAYLIKHVLRHWRMRDGRRHANNTTQPSPPARPRSFTVAQSHPTPPLSLRTNMPYQSAL